MMVCATNAKNEVETRVYPLDIVGFKLSWQVERHTYKSTSIFDTHIIFVQVVIKKVYIIDDPRQNKHHYVRRSILAHLLTL
jgi:hypothetical protein